MNESVHEALVKLLMNKRDTYDRVAGDIPSEELATAILEEFDVTRHQGDLAVMTARQIVEGDGHGWDT